ncbi:MAG: Lrp/AsnC family transcriptional regulator [Brumimicrobium sp.]
MKIDSVDEEIIKILQADAKSNIKSIANQLNMTKTPIYERIRRLEQEGIIEKYVAVINHQKMKNGMFVFCSVSLEVQKLEHIERFKQEISGIPEVMECYLMGGANDFLLKLFVEDLNAYHQFSSGKLAALDNVSQIKSTFVLDVVKKEGGV